MTHATLDIDGRRLGAGHPCYVIAEAGVNHGGSLPHALALIDAAADAGADAVKFQTFRTERLASIQAPTADYQAQRCEGVRSQMDLLRALELDEAAHRTLMAHARSRGITFLSTPFEEGSADLLETLGLPAFKVPSGEVTNLPFLAHLARKGRPILMSTGMATLGEVERALQVLATHGAPEVALLHCVSSYPTEASDANLRAMATLAQAFQVPVGYSDHTEGLEVSLAAVALGATILEKHFTLDRSLPGPDQACSLEPGELAALVRCVRRVESALGHGRKVPAPCERNTADVARKSLVAAHALTAGARLEAAHLLAKRPGTGISPEHLPLVLGRTLRRDLPPDALVAWEDLA